MTNSNLQLYKQATVAALPFTIFFAIMCVIMAVLFAVTNASNANDNSQAVTTDDSVEVMLNDIQTAIDNSGIDGITIIYNK